MERSINRGQQHNQYNQIQHSTTFPEIAAACRRLAFKHYAEESMTMENMIPPRYNTQKYREWKKDCMHLCITPQVAS